MRPNQPSDKVVLRQWQLTASRAIVGETGVANNVSIFVVEPYFASGSGFEFEKAHGAQGANEAFGHHRDWKNEEEAVCGT
jgi:hypothetical protein